MVNRPDWNDQGSAAAADLAGFDFGEDSLGQIFDEVRCAAFDSDFDRLAGGESANTQVVRKGVKWVN
jgi:hypothetical protein